MIKTKLCQHVYCYQKKFRAFAPLRLVIPPPPSSVSTPPGGGEGGGSLPWGGTGWVAVWGFLGF